MASIGGSPKLEILEKVRDEAAKMKDVELRVTPDESVYIINLTGKEADRLLKITEEDCARNPFETSVSCVGATICQVGLRDSQGMLKKQLKRSEKPISEMTRCQRSLSQDAPVHAELIKSDVLDSGAQ